MKKQAIRLRASMLISAAAATIGYSHYSFAATFLIYDANSQATAPDPTTDAGGDWSSTFGGTQTQITAGPGTGPDGNYWQITDPVTNGSRGYVGFPTATQFADPTGWTATEVVKVLQSAGPKQAPTATVGPYAAPSFLDVRGNGDITTVGQVNAGADEYFFRAQSGASSTNDLVEMDTHSYFNTYQMVYTPEQLDGLGNLIALPSLAEYVNGHLMMDANASVFNTTTLSKFAWFSGAQTSLQTIQYQLLKFESGDTVVPAPAAEVWNVNGGGELTLGTNWMSGNVPSGTNSTGQLGQTDAPANMTVSNPLSIGLLQLNNTSGYTISGAGTLTLVQSERGAGAIDVDSGHQVISAPISPERSGIFTILDPTASLSLTGIVNTVGKDFRKAGPGAMDVANVRANSLKVSAGTLTIRPNGTAAGVSKVTSLDISFNTTAALAPVATMDLNDNPLIIDYTGTSPTATLRASLKGAYDGGAWDGQGLTSSVVKANAANTSNPVKTALGYAEASAIGVTQVGDQTLDSTSLLVRMTLSGDSNLDGKVNASDFDVIAANYGTTTGKIWGQGDFNYDGVVNTLDFNMMAANFNQTMSLAPSVALGTLVPEPVAAGTLLLALSGLCGRRRMIRR